jgi:hypothetical protein
MPDESTRPIWRSRFGKLSIVRAIFADWERGDLGSLRWADPEIDSVFAGGPEPGTHGGRAAMRALFGRWLNSLADFRLLADRVIEVDHERVLALTHVGGQGETSGQSGAGGLGLRSPVALGLEA